MSVNSDFSDLLSELNAAEVRYLVVGGYAVFFHAQPRYTKDLDIWVEPTPENATRVLEALRRFGAPLHDLTAADLSAPGITFQMGNAPNRIDLLTEVASLTFPAAWDHRVEGRYGAQRMWLLSREDLIANKRAARDLKTWKTSGRWRRALPPGVEPGVLRLRGAGLAVGSAPCSSRTRSC